MLNTVNEISSKNRSLGWMILQIYQSSKDEKWFVALISLFVVMEQYLRFYSSSSSKKTFSYIIKEAYEKNYISHEEASTLNLMRKCRNDFMHASFHDSAFVINGLIHPVSEDETAEIIFSELFKPCLTILLKIA